MKRAVAAVVAIVFLVSSAWSFANGDIIEAWLVGQISDPDSDELRNLCRCKTMNGGWWLWLI